jgi:hypothetical protein
MSSKQWGKAEEVLGDALNAAEAAAGAADSSSSSSSGVLVPVLLLLASGYCRSVRVMLAEGLLREAAKLLGGSEPHRCVEGWIVFVCVCGGGEGVCVCSGVCVCLGGGGFNVCCGRLPSCWGAASYTGVSRVASWVCGGQGEKYGSGGKEEK